MARITNRAVFNESLLPDGEARWGSFGAGFGLECLVLTAILVIPLLMPQKLEMVQRYWTTPIEAPVVQPWKPQPPQPQPKPVVKPAPMKVAKVEPKPVVVEVPKPKIISPVFTSPVAKPATAHKTTKAPDTPEVAKAYPDQTLPSMGSSAIPNLRKPREEVQTGGFGDPNGVPANGKTNRSPNIAAKGGYDMPTGPGNGNGTGGAKGSKGVVASSGFGNGVATGSGGNANHGTVQQAGFADQATAAPAPKVKAVAAPTSKATPVEILFKPKPAYTDEARAKKIEGDVLLQVVFTAGGDVQIQRVVQGLGYGLDGSAQAAARQIRFKPAQQEGHAVDYPAIVHITFALAY
ncbi:MAG: energy transducer TonB [Candidatus Acidiferrales bacterium]